jgi:hypothetical protein
MFLLPFAKAILAPYQDSSITYLISENFEGTGKPEVPAGFTSDWPTPTAGRIEYDVTTNPLEGSQSAVVNLPSTSEISIYTPHYTGSAETMYAAFQVQMKSYPTGVYSAFLWYSASVQQAAPTVNTSGQVRSGVVGGITGPYLTHAVIPTGSGQWAYVKFRYARGSGSNAESQVWITDTTSSWGPTSSLSYGGTNTNYPTRFFMARMPSASFATGSEAWIKVDQFRMSTSDIPISAMAGTKYYAPIAMVYSSSMGSLSMNSGAAVSTSLLIPQADNSILLTTVGAWKGTTLPIWVAPKYNGLPMTQSVLYYYTGSAASSREGVGVYYVMGPQSGSASLNVTSSTATLQIGISSVVMSNVDQSNPFENMWVSSSTGLGANQTGSLSVTSSITGYPVGCFSYYERALTASANTVILSRHSSSAYYATSLISSVVPATAPTSSMLIYSTPVLDQSWGKAGNTLRRA